MIPMLRVESTERRKVTAALDALTAAYPEQTFALGHLTWTERGEIQARYVVVELTTDVKRGTPLPLLVQCGACDDGRTADGDCPKCAGLGRRLPVPDGGEGEGA